MSTTTTTINNPIEQGFTTTPSNNNNSNRGGYYKSFLKPGRFWQRGSNKVASSSDDDQQKQQDGYEEQDEEHQYQQQPVEQPSSHTNNTHHHNNKKSFISMPTPFKPSTKPDRQQTPALREAAKAEVYKLSTVNDSGIFLPPSPKLDSKRDHWIEMDEESMTFRLPSPECLTTYGNNDKTNPIFYTPSAMVFSRSSSVDTNNEDDIPSLITDLSSAN